MVMRLFLTCTELGLGHVTRIIPLGKKLAEKGHELFFFSGGTAYNLLKREFENVCPCTPVAWYETSKGVLASASFLNILFPLPRFNYEKNRFEIKNASGMETVHRYYDLRCNISRIRPDLIISDGDMHALRLADRWNIPSVYITNIIRPSYGFSPLFTPGERFTERYVRKCTKIIVPDNPPPYTICAYNLGDLDRMQLKGKIEFVGSFLDMKPIKGRKDHILAPISGPLGTRAILMHTIIPVLRQTETKSIVSLGQPGEKHTSRMGNCEIHTWLTQEERREYMKNAKLIAFSGGHGTCFETIKHGKPSICIPTQPEQMGNARKLQELKCSTTVANQKQFAAALSEIEISTKSYRRNVEKLRGYSSRFSGLDRAVRAVEETI